MILVLVSCSTVWLLVLLLLLSLLLLLLVIPLGGEAKCSLTGVPGDFSKSVFVLSTLPCNFMCFLSDDG